RHRAQCDRSCGNGQRAAAAPTGLRVSAPRQIADRHLSVEGNNGHRTSPGYADQHRAAGIRGTGSLSIGPARNPRRGQARPVDGSRVGPLKRERVSVSTISLSYCFFLIIEAFTPLHPLALLSTRDIAGTLAARVLAGDNEH